jgi:CRP-like cAMP-binding protein
VHVTVEHLGRAACIGEGSLKCLLDIDSDLADELDRGVLRAARGAAVALTFQTEPGRLPVPEWLEDAAPGPGVLVLDGVLVVEVRVGDRNASELIGAGDLIQPGLADHADHLSCDVAWRALEPSHFALLDAAFAKRVRFWPQITYELLHRASRRTARLNVQRAIASQPRLEVRLALLLWHLAARWGKVERGGLLLPLPLTHQLLGRLVGAERPSVSHALARLAQTGLVTGHGDEWHLHGDLRTQLPGMLAGRGPRESDMLMSSGAFGA